MALHDVAKVAGLGSLPPRIRDRIVVVGECWIWIGCKTSKGYGRASFRGHGGPEVWCVHTITYTLLVGPVPQGKILDHKIEEGICTSRACCNPSHLQPMTIVENIRKSPTSMASVHARKLTCPKGHPYSHLDIDGSRRCRTCHNADEARRRERLRNASIT